MAAETLVVEETPSLGSSVVALLEADGLEVRRFPDLPSAERFHESSAGGHPLVVVASNSHSCPSAARWGLGPLRGASMIVVGTRDPALRSSGRLHVVRLPLEPQKLLELVHALVEPAPDGPSASGAFERGP